MLLAHRVTECATQGAIFAAKGLTICQNAGGGVARLTGARANGMALSATGGRAAAADAKNAESAVSENGGSAKNGEATWGAMARKRKQTTKIGGPLQSIRPVFDKTRVCFGGTEKVVGRKRGEMDKTWDVLTEKRGKMLKTGIFWGTES